jgi:predicted AlkP superfamily phosphohydrolase/phosphomutase
MFRPQELHDELLRAVGSWRPDATLPGTRRRQDYLGLFRREIPKTAAGFQHLLDMRPWRFAMVYFVEAAMAQHYFWNEMARDDPADPYRSLISEAYQELDAAIGSLAAAAGPGTDVFVISECGAGPIRSGVQINTWLEEQGLLRRRVGIAGRPAARLSTTLRRNAKAWLPPGIQVLLSRMPARMVDWARSSGTVLDLDWPATRVFSRGKEGDIFINLKGRDPQGVVAPGREYEDLREDVIRRLRGLIDPVTGEPAVTEALRREDCFEGPQLAALPDIIVRWRDASYLPDEQERVPGAVFAPRYRKDMTWPTTGSHRYEGMLVATGPDIARGVDLGRIAPFDLLPTWLALFGIAAPGGVQGRILAAVEVAA